MFASEVQEMLTYIRNDDSKLWVECMVHLADCSLVTPEGVVVLTVLGIWITDCGEHLVPRRGIGVCLWHTVWWLPTNQNTDWCWLELWSCSHYAGYSSDSRNTTKLLKYVFSHLYNTHLIIYFYLFYDLILVILRFHRTGMLQKWTWTDYNH